MDDIIIYETGGKSVKFNLKLNSDTIWAINVLRKYITRGVAVNEHRFAELSARNLVQSITQSKHPQLSKFITALGIRHVGTQTATTLIAGAKPGKSKTDKAAKLGLPVLDETEFLKLIGEAVKS